MTWAFTGQGVEHNVLLAAVQEMCAPETETEVTTLMCFLKNCIPA